MNEEAYLERKKILSRIEELEKQGIFDQDVEDDPPSKTILPGTVDYRQKKLISRIKSKIAFAQARKFLNRILKDQTLIIDDVLGVEYLDQLQSGAVITCNHFSPLDSFAMQVAYETSACHKKRKLFRVIREGNYTSFPGFYGMLMRNCNTLPLSSNLAAMKEFLDGVDYQLKKGHLVLIYPEQSLWWNYRKPKPLKKGAFRFAVKANVPVVPIFITMQDSDVIGEDGFPNQRLTIHILPPILPEEGKSDAENMRDMCEKNYRLWKEVYEKTYGIPLTYLCDKKPS